MTNDLIHEAARQARKSRTQRVDSPPPLCLTDRDLAILHAVTQQRLLTVTEVTWLFFSKGGAAGRGPASAAARRLRVLYDAGLVARVFRPVRLGEGQKAIAYTLDRAGAYELARAGLMPPEALVVRRRQVEPLFYDHTLAVARVWAALGAASAATRGLRLAHWRGESELRQASAAEGQRQLEAGEREAGGAGPLIPDGAFHLTLEAEGARVLRARFCLEVDRATEERREVTAKLRWLAASPEYRSHFLLFAILGERRLRSLADVLGRVVEDDPSLQDRVLVAEAVGLTPQTVLTAWRVLPSGECRPLVPQAVRVTNTTVAGR